ncbi:MAG TPA: acyloxyacyl hydrolase [Verrucomicrobiae bacterium]|jgi:opacity protein-like surface antigen|nr:acyloxyacyl hydrolase [Verrucomicrobiae bacterium]
MKKMLTWFGVSTLVAISAFADANVELNSSAKYDADLSYNSAFQKGRWELGINSGVMFSPFFDLVTRRTVDYTTTGLQGGYMLSNPMGSSWYRGNVEVIVEAFGGDVIRGEGSYVAGTIGWMRYNFLTSCRLKPYFQLGGGIEMTDIDGHLLGQRQNFNLDLGLGLRYMLTKSCALNAEYRFQHFSDAYQTRVNLGNNAQGPVVGISWFF